MSARRSLSAVLLALVAGAVGCATPYRPPTTAQPHAIMKLRRTYQTSAGTHLHESVAVVGHAAFEARDASQSAGAARTDAILVHPKTAEIRVSAGFSHTEMRTVQEAYTVQVPYTTTETYSCGSGSSYRTCTRSATHYRSETRYRTVVRAVEVSDGACGASVWFSPAVNGAYILEYEYAQDTLCRLACFDQAPGAEPGTFENRPCGVPSGADVRRAKAAR